MATVAIFAQGTLLKRGDGATPTEAFTTMADVLSIDGPGMSRDVIDVTSHSSTGGFREYINGLKDGDTVTFDVNYDPQNATHQNFLADYASGDTTNYTMTFPDTSDWTFSGIVQNAGVVAPVDAQLTLNGVIKVTGAVTTP